MKIFEILQINLRMFEFDFCKVELLNFENVMILAEIKGFIGF